MDAVPDAVTLDRALVLSGPGVPMDRHGVYAADGTACRPALLRQGERQVTGHATHMPAAPGLPGEFVYGGLIAGHFGHMLLETFARLNVFETSDLPVLFSTLPQSKMDLFWTLADAMGLPRERIVLSDAPCVVDRLHVTAPDFEIRRRCAPAFAQSYARRGAAMAARLGVRENQNHRPAYLSRSKLPKRGRYVFGETLLEALLAAKGVDIIHPQELSFDEQAALWITRRRFGGFAGSAFHPVLLTNARKKLTYLTPHRVNRNFQLIESEKDNAHRFVLVNSNKLAINTMEAGPFLMSRVGIVGACRAMGVAAEVKDVPDADYKACVAAYQKAVAAG